MTALQDYPTPEEAYEQLKRAVSPKHPHTTWQDCAPIVYATHLRVKRLDILGTDQHRKEFDYQYQVNLELARLGHRFSLTDTNDPEPMLSRNQQIAKQTLRSLRATLEG